LLRFYTYNADMRADPGSLRERLKESIENAWRLYCALEVMLPYKEASRGQPMSRQKLTASTIPWHGQAAGLIHDFYAEVRRLEVNLKAVVTGVRGVRRGGSDGNTLMALRSIANFSHTVDDQTVMGVLGYFNGWVRKAEAVFNPDLGLHRIPRHPGEDDMRCPWCTYQTMRWQPATGIIVCVNPECTNDDGVRPRWRAEYQVVGDEMQFTWEPMGEAA
jgi:hypothetical protein